MSKSLYKQNIIDNYKNPRNFGELEDCDLHSEVENSSCGDEIKLFLNIEEDRIKEIKFSGRGCAISIATMSILSEKLKGMSMDDIKNLDKWYVLEMVGMEESSGRVKCALIGYDALIKALG